MILINSHTPVQGWRPGRRSPDLWTSTTSVGPFQVHEIEASNAAVLPGRPARDRFDFVLRVEPARGFAIAWDHAAPWPTTWPVARACWRRCVTYPADRPDLEARARMLAQADVRSDWRQTRTAFGPLEMPLPDLTPQVLASVAASYRGHYLGLRAAVENGTVYAVEDSQDGLVMSPVSGWRWHGPVHPWAHGGSGITHDTGWQSCLDFFRLAQIQAQLEHARMDHAYHLSTGEPLTPDDYPGDSPSLYGQSQPEQAHGAASDPLPPPYQTSHGIRGIRYTAAYAEACTSSMARRSIASRAARVRMEHSEKAEPRHGTWPSDLRTALLFARDKPGIGYPNDFAGRIYGWAMWITALGRRFGKCSGPGWDKWFNGWLEFCDLAAPAHGIVQKVHQPGWWSDSPDHDSAQSFEAALFWIGAAGLARSCGRRLPRGLFSACTTLYAGHLPIWPYHGEWGPPHYVHVFAHAPGGMGMPYDPVTLGKGSSPGDPGDSAHVDTLLAVAASVDRVWLDVAARLTARATDARAKRGDYSKRTDLRGRAFLLGQDP